MFSAVQIGGVVTQDYPVRMVEPVLDTIDNERSAASVRAAVHQASSANNDEAAGI